MKNKMNRDKIEKLVKQINAENLIILEGAISVLSALRSDYCEITKVILKLDLENNNTRKIVDAARFDIIEYFSYAELGIFEEMLNGENVYRLGKTHGGIIALARKRRYLTPLELAEQAQVIAVIEGIEDPYNLGYAVRALYTQGVDGLLLPERDFGFSESIIEKASTGTFYKMPVAVFSDKPALIELLKDRDFTLYCVNHKAPPDSQAEVRDIFQVRFAERAVFIIGGEKRGISRVFLQNADEIVRIPYANAFSHSLAAQTAATIVAYEIHRQRRK